MQYSREGAEMLLQHNINAGGLFTGCKKGTHGEKKKQIGGK